MEVSIFSDFTNCVQGQFLFPACRYFSIEEVLVVILEIFWCLWFRWINKRLKISLNVSHLVVFLLKCFMYTLKSFMFYISGIVSNPVFCLYVQKMRSKCLYAAKFWLSLSINKLKFYSENWSPPNLNLRVM